MRQISESKRNNVVQCLSNGFSARETASKTGVSKSTINRISQVTLGLKSKPRIGRPPKVTSTNIDYIVQLVTKSGVESASKVSRILSNDLGVSLSATSIRRLLKSRGIVPLIKPKKPLLRKKNIADRVAFAKSHIAWTETDWKHVVWSDETKINLFGSDGIHWCYKRKDTQLKPQHVQQTVKHGGGSVMVWSCITWSGVGFLVFIDGNMDKQLYKTILQEDLLRTLEDYHLNQKDVVFVHDNDPKHKSMLVTDWLKNQEFETMVWPAQSPDLNPIENVWSLLKRRIYSNYDKPPTSIKELKERITETWYAITPEEVRPYLLSVNKRCQEVIRAKGYWINH